MVGDGFLLGSQPKVERQPRAAFHPERMVRDLAVQKSLAVCLMSVMSVMFAPLETRLKAPNCKPGSQVLLARFLQTAAELFR